jgi:hypothetical protein
MRRGGNGIGELAIEVSTTEPLALPELAHHGHWDPLPRNLCHVACAACTLRTRAMNRTAMRESSGLRRRWGGVDRAAAYRGRFGMIHSAGQGVPQSSRAPEHPRCHSCAS